MITFVAGLLVTAALAVTAAVLYSHNEKRLLGLRARELGLVIRTAVPTLQTPLVSAAELADATGGSARKFRAFAAPLVGPGRQFVSVSLWAANGPLTKPAAVVGSAPSLGLDPEQARHFMAHAKQSRQLSVTHVLPRPTPRLGYAFYIPGPGGGYIAYAENPLPSNRRSKVAENTGFSDLNYAIYLGRSTAKKDLLVSDIKHFPVSGRHASTTVPFGDSAFMLVVTPNKSLGGSFFESLPWIIVILGVMITLAASMLTERLARRRAYAERLAGVLDRVAAENREMYTQQRSIAQTLQHALLPEALPVLPGLQVSASYVPAASGIDVGGDWYDVVPCEGDRVLLVIGDVSGHGLRAATTMASLRHATLAYAAEDPTPASVLFKLSNFVNASSPDYFATVLCVLVDASGHSMSISSAGHLPPLLVDGDRGRFLEFEPDIAIGVTRDWKYRETTVAARAGASLIAFTDGLVERRAEMLDIGLERLRAAATREQLGLEQLVQRLAHELSSEEHNDDTAIVGIRWQS
ncbi:MAG TPA: PP2C family protein-serine/threonine phosphatase [Gemmatimonadales bacterium]|nr:PP2C family protein-serine/threonine phosphatase [Gemmatimonadales bacterium]